MKLEILKEIIKKDIIEDREAIEVVREYIYEKTGKFITHINRPIGQIYINTEMNEVTTDFDLLTKMYAVAKAYYKTK